jgi:hypothetical protein
MERVEHGGVGMDAVSAQATAILPIFSILGIIRPISNLGVFCISTRNVNAHV